MNMKIDRSYEDFFYSFGVALTICTLLVSVGKLITYYYFFYIVICSLLIIISLMIYDYYAYKAALTKLEEAREVQHVSVETQITSKSKPIKTKVDASTRATSYDGGLRKRTWTNKVDQKHLKAVDIIQMHLPLKMSQSNSADENDSHKRAIISKCSTKEAQRFSNIRRRALYNSYMKEEQRCNMVKVKNTLV